MQSILGYGNTLLCYSAPFPSLCSLSLFLCPIITVANCAEFLVYERINVIGCAKIVVSHMNTRASTHPNSRAECEESLFINCTEPPTVGLSLQVCVECIWVCMHVSEYMCLCMCVCVCDCTLQFASVAQRIENCSWAQAKRVIIDYAEPSTVASSWGKARRVQSSWASHLPGVSSACRSWAGVAAAAAIANKLLLLLYCCCCAAAVCLLLLLLPALCVISTMMMMMMTMKPAMANPPGA